MPAGAARSSTEPAKTPTFVSTGSGAAAGGGGGGAEPGGGGGAGGLLEELATGCDVSQPIRMMPKSNASGQTATRDRMVRSSEISSVSHAQSELGFPVLYPHPAVANEGPRMNFHFRRL